MPLRALLYWLAASVALAGCTVTNDLGNPCRLVKKDPTDDAGVRSVPITEGQINPGDFISFGATECENYICVRDAQFPKGTDPNAPAFGYCSNACTTTSTNNCKASAGNITDGRLLNCRALVLSDLTLHTICSTDPVTCAKLGSISSSFYCAKGTGIPDGGS